MKALIKVLIFFSLIFASVHCMAVNNKWLNEASEMTWGDAMSYCNSVGASLPTENQMKQEIVACGGKVEGNYWPQENEINKKYQSCIAGKGFEGDYWTSTPNSQTAECASDVYFRTGQSGCAMKTEALRVRCVAK